MPSLLEQASSACVSWETATPPGMMGNFNAMYERYVRGGTRAFPSNMGATVGTTPNTDIAAPVSYAGDMVWANYSQEQVPATLEQAIAEEFPEGMGDTVPTVNPQYYAVDQAYADTVPPPLSPYPTPTRGDRRSNIEEARLNEFRRAVRDECQKDRDDGYSTREYIKGLTNGELAAAAKAYEHLRPELWPFKGIRPFDAARRSEWGRLARAAAFLEQECRRIGAQSRLSDEALGEHKDAENEIRRLAFKAVDQRWPRHQECNAVEFDDPF